MKKNVYKLSFFGILSMILLVNGCEQIQRIYSINRDKCIRCSQCIPACGYGAIRIDTVAYTTADSIEYSTTVVIDAKKCVGCGECKLVCPQDAIATGWDDGTTTATTSGQSENSTTSSSGSSTSTTTTTTTTTSGTTTYSVSSSRCTGCRRCASACSAGAISFSSGKAVINASKCTGCGKCVSYCPRSAISKN